MTRPHRAAASLLLAAAALLAPLTAAHAAEDPTLILPAPRAEPGDFFPVSGDGWSAGDTLVVSVCGNNALLGSNDCDPTSSATVVVGATGYFSTPFFVAAPPKPCPCVIQAVTRQNGIEATTPIEVVGHPIAPVSGQRPSPDLTLDVAADTATTLGSLLGASADLTAVITITNEGQAPADGAVRVTAGPGKAPVDEVGRVSFNDLPPGDTLIRTVEVTVPAPAAGRYTVLVSTFQFGELVTASASATTYPWLTIVATILLLQIPLLGLHRRQVAADAPDDPLELAIEDLAAPPPAFGITTVRGLVDDYADPLAPERDPEPQVIVAGAGAPSGRARRRVR